LNFETIELPNHQIHSALTNSLFLFRAASKVGRKDTLFVECVYDKLGGEGRGRWEDGKVVRRMMARMVEEGEG